MNIKSLLLGSAAALVAVSGAQAADIIIPVEPEPEYVRVCDVYGAGFYYIPGTETCLSINGYVRFKYAVVGNVAEDEDDEFDDEDYDAGSQVRARINLDVREETELGTLRGFVRFEANNVFGTGVLGEDEGSQADFDMDMAFIQLGGLTMGYNDSLWTQGDALFTDTDLATGDETVNLVSYTFAGGGFDATISLEDDGTGDFAPDVVGNVGFESGFGGVELWASYDESVTTFDFATAGAFDEGDFDETVDDVDGDGDVDAFDATLADLLDDDVFTPAVFGLAEGDDDDGAFALKGNITLEDLLVADSQFRIEATYAFDPSKFATISIFDNVATVGDQRDIGTLPIEWAAGAGYAQGLGRFGFAVAGIYGETFEVAGDFDNVGDVGFGELDSLGEGQFYRLVGNVGYEITNNFDVLGEISYANLEFEDVEGSEIDQTTGFVQFVRSF